MPIIHITTLSHPGLEVYATLTEAQLRNRLEPERAVFIAESPKVVRTALSVGMVPLSMLCEERHITGDAADIIAQFPDMPVYTGEREVLSSLTGYTLTRGVLCALRRPEAPSLEDICRTARRVAVLQSVTDTTNIGSIFRSAAALGWDAVLLTPDTCDPLNRRAVRVSMGSVFLIPWTWLRTSDPINELRAWGFRTAAMALAENSVALDSPSLSSEPRLAVILGTEGDGLPQNTVSCADHVVRIPMAYGVDSLNVGAAAAIAFWELCRRS